jgi:hypothetical protein
VEEAWLNSRPNASL